MLVFYERFDLKEMINSSNGWRLFQLNGNCQDTQKENKQPTIHSPMVKKDLCQEGWQKAMGNNLRKHHE